MLLLAAALAFPGRGVSWTFSPIDQSHGGDALPSPIAPTVDEAIDLGSSEPVAVIVTASPGSVAAVEEEARAIGVAVGARLPLVHGFEARLSGRQAAELARSGGVKAITLDRVGRFEELTYESATTASNFVRTTGAAGAWSQGNHGQGVGVAVIDTGIAEMKDLAGRIVHGPDLSGEGRTIDSYGHGTVMAGAIAGSGADSAGQASGAYTGVAPKAHVVSVKVAGRNGSVDVSTMLQAMHWVAAYKDQYNIRVLNLSWGVPSTQDPSVDPLNYAVQRLWDQGIVVVVAAGNSGPNSGTIRKPGDDPKVITVGAFDDKQNTDPADDAVSAWSSRGPTAQGLAKPDVIAPGRLVVATRSFGSKIEADYPKALISPSYIRGSGTSQAAAITSGVVALLLSARPSLSPDQVKAVLKGTASPIGGKVANDQGSGRIDLGRALTADPGPATWQSTRATGLGSIDASRGGRYVETDCGANGTIDVIRGEIDVRCEAWDPAAWTGTAWTGTAWTGTAWTGTAWTGTAWTGTAWTGTAWTGTAWTGGEWTGGSWQGTAWTGTAWTGTAWTGTAWTGTAWTGTAWTGTAWTGNDFTTAEYEDVFLTAWWGLRPPIGVVIPGEPITTFVRSGSLVLQ